MIFALKESSDKQLIFYCLIQDNGLIFHYENNGKGLIFIEVQQAYYRKLNMRCWMADKNQWGTTKDILKNKVLQKPVFKRAVTGHNYEIKAFYCFSFTSAIYSQLVI